MRLRGFVSILATVAVVTGAGPSAIAQNTDVKLPIDAIDFSLASVSPPWINAIGEFDDDAPKRLEEFIVSHKAEIKPGATVQLSCHGGSLFSGMEVGAMIQQHGLNTVVGSLKFLSGDNVCASACTLAFIGGLSRLVLSDAKFAIHAPRVVRPDGSEYAPDEKVFSARDLSVEYKIMGAVLRYVRNQGVDPLAVAAMYEVFPYGNPAESIRTLTHADLVLWRIDNSVPVPRDILAQTRQSSRLRQELCSPVQRMP